jgi:hypothetical protein
VTDHEKNFRKWFVDALDPLRRKGDAGFIFAFVSLPLLERYLRQKSGAGEAIRLPPQFFVELGKLFPEIAGREDRMWHCYRNGLLHQAAFSQQKRRQGMVVVLNAALSGHDKRPIYYDISGDCFYMNPEEFFDRVTNTILGDFAAYLGSLSPAHRLPTIAFPSTVIPGVAPTITGLIPGASGSYKP